MSSCAVKRGIITLRDCHNPVTGTCGQCNRPICTEHTATGTVGTMCIECRGRALESEARGPGGKTNAKKTATGEASDAGYYEDESWPYMYRHHYYTTTHYTPFYSGGYYDSYYDSYDVRSLESTEESGMGEEGEAGGFYDS